jgi:NAD(P)-dependent dehydrogenase (short-subunit alcohol dehydrogenase family)
MASGFAGKVAVITGAAGGIGRATAVRLGTAGARVVLVDLATAPLDAAADAVRKAGGEAVTVAADVTRSGDVVRYVDAATSAYGGIDLFFNNAGILGAVAPLVAYPEETFDRVIAVNVKGVWLGLKHVGPAIAARGGGAIVNTASIAGLRGTPNVVAYTASKHAVIGLTRTGSRELIHRGVRVNAVCPAPIETPMVDELGLGFEPGNAQAFHERMAATIPMRRYGTADEVAALVMFLLSDEASYVNGGIYTVDGGAMA